jgi:hypothetical protein
VTTDRSRWRLAAPISAVRGRSDIQPRRALTVRLQCPETEPIPMCPLPSNRLIDRLNNRGNHESALAADQRI